MGWLLLALAGAGEWGDGFLGGVRLLPLGGVNPLWRGSLREPVQRRLPLLPLQRRGLLSSRFAWGYLSRAGLCRLWLTAHRWK